MLVACTHICSAVKIRHMTRRADGQNHPRAKLTTHEVELIRQLRAEGMDYRTLAAKFDTSERYIGKICRYERRAYG